MHKYSGTVRNEQANETNSTAKGTIDKEKDSMCMSIEAESLDINHLLDIKTIV